MTIVYAPDDTRRWLARFDGEIPNGPVQATWNDVAQNVRFNSVGNVYVTGWTWRGMDPDGGTEEDIVLLKYSATGALLWKRLFNGPVDRGDFPTDMEIDDSGNVYIAGYSTGGQIGVRYYYESLALNSALLALSSGTGATRSTSAATSRWPEHSTPLATSSSRARRLATTVAQCRTLSRSSTAPKAQWCGPLRSSRDSTFSGLPGTRRWIRAATSTLSASTSATSRGAATSSSLSTRARLARCCGSAGGRPGLLRRLGTVCRHRRRRKRVRGCRARRPDAAHAVGRCGAVEVRPRRDTALGPDLQRTGLLALQRFDGDPQLEVTSSGDAYLALQSQDAKGRYRFTALKYLPDGTRAWLKRVPVHSRNDAMWAMALDGQNNVILAGNSSQGAAGSGDQHLDYMVAKLLAA